MNRYIVKQSASHSRADENGYFQEFVAINDVGQFVAKWFTEQQIDRTKPYQLAEMRTVQERAVNAMDGLQAIRIYREWLELGLPDAHLTSRSDAMLKAREARP